MAYQVRYEWDIETIDPETDDILDHNHADENDLDRLLPDFVTQDPTMRLVLVRDKGNDLDGLVDRAWAYVDDNWFVPKTFTYCGEPEQDSGIAVPKRFHRMIARAAR